MAVGPDQDGVVARGGPGLDAPADLGGDPVGLLRPGGEDLEPDRRWHRGGALGSQSLEDPGPHLEPVRVVEPDQPIGGIEDRREGPIVAPQDDRPRPEIPLAEVEDVVDRRAAERVDRLVVVADHGDVPVALGERGDQLRLRAVGVLELVDQDVAEPAGDRAPGGRRRPDQAEGQRHLVAEVDAAVGGEQGLIRAVRARQLGLAPGILAGGCRDLEAVRARLGRGPGRRLGQ